MNFVRARKTVGFGLMASSLLVGLLAAPAATAAEGDQVPEGLEEVTVVKQAYWNADQSKYSDNAATSEFPPQAVCLVQPQACFFPEQDNPDDPTGLSGDVGATLNEGSATAGSTEQELLAQIAEADSGDEPGDAVPPDTHPVSVAFGEANYRSAIEFELPQLPEGQQVDDFTVALVQGDPTYANESPAFRQAVLAALTCASENDEPQGRCTQQEFEKIPNSELSDGSPLLVEACPITSDWEAGVAKDEDNLPEVDCLFTASGTPVDVDGEVVWLFDLTFAAQAWFDGTLDYKGFLLRPGAAENFAYGDPETTYSKQVTFQPQVQVAMATSEEPAPLPAPPAPSGSTGAPAPTTSTSTPPAPASSSSVSVPTGGTNSRPQTSEQPAVAETTETPAATSEQPAVAEQPQTLAAGTPLGTPETPWWIWALVPMFLAGAWLMSRALEEQAAMATTQRSGAMTRLLERQAAQSKPDLVTG